ncbi:MAG TPA: ABC transporter permease [Longimicrobiales bacterium]|nr:ABC transporter permease [Longimicrobiales bacterium]
MMGLPSRIIRMLSSLFEPELRDGWVREWEAELAHAEHNGRRRVRIVAWAAEDALRHFAGPRLLHAVPQDAFQAMRGLRRSPGYATAVVLTLALGIGANTAIFSVVDTYLIRPLDLRDPDRVVLLSKIKEGSFGFTSAPNYVDWKEQSGSFESMAAGRTAATTLTGLDSPVRLSRALVTPGFFETIGTGLFLGRGFLEEESDPAKSFVAVLSHEIWQSAYGGDPAMLGRELVLDGESHIVVGVLPAGFNAPPFTSSVWTPLAFTPEDVGTRGRNNLQVVGRLREGISLAAAGAEMDGIGRRLAQAHPQSNEGWTVAVRPLREAVVSSTEKPLWILLGAAGFVLLIACVNVGNLVVARGVSRRREFAVRVALGASRGRLAIQLLGETGILSLAGGALGVVLAAAALGPLQSLVPASVASLGTVAVDGRVLAFGLAASLISGGLAGLTPALRLSRTAGREAGVGAVLRVRSETGGRGVVMVATQFALATVLLVGAGLMTRSLMALYAVDLGVRHEGLTSFGVTFPSASYGKPEEVVAAVDGVLSELESLGLEATVTSHLPLSGARLTSSVLLEGRDTEMSTNGPAGAIKVVGPAYFEILDVPLLAGRTFTASDDHGAEPVAVINARAAELYWPGEDPVGRWIAYAQDESGAPMRRRVVGVVGDVHFAGPGQPPTPEVYAPHHQTTVAWRWFGSAMSFVVATPDGSVLSARLAQAVVSAVDPDLPVAGPRPLTEVLHGSVGTPWFHGTLISLFAGLALLLAVVGLYGVTDFSVRRRRPEIGVRMALGASRPMVVRQILGRALRMAALGAAVGLVGAVGLARIVSGMVWGVSPRDPLTYAAAVGVMTLVAALAAWLPAYRSSRVDPMTSLTAE